MNIRSWFAKAWSSMPPALPARDPHPGLEAGHIPPSQAPEMDGLKAPELGKPQGIVHEIENPSTSGDRSMMARMLDKVRGGAGTPFGKPHREGYAGGKDNNPPVTTSDEECPYPIARSRVDNVLRGSGAASQPPLPPMPTSPAAPLGATRTQPMVDKSRFGDQSGQGRW
jgi:hypothetical protein